MPWRRRGRRMNSSEALGGERENMVQGTLIIAFMVLLIILMVTKKCPTLIAVPALAIGIAVIGGMPLHGGKGGDILKTVINDGSTKLAGSYAAVLVATWLGSIMARTGISETMIRKAAELGGDKTLFIAILLFAVTCALSSAMSGLGAVIMIGTIVIPILISVGVDKFTAAGIMLLAYSCGGQYGLVRANYFAGVFNLEVPAVYNYSLIVAAATSVASIAFILFRYYRNGRKFAFSARVCAAEIEDDHETYELKGFTGLLALLTPFVPIFVVVLFGWPIYPAFLLAIVWGLLWTSKGWRKTCNLAAKTCYEGFLVGAPCAALMIFIGMLLNAISNENVKRSLEPLINTVTPTTAVATAAFFIILTPLVLYRGPLNMYGLGAGIAALMAAAGVLSPMMVCVGFLGVAAIQNAACPTNTHNVWVAGFVEEDVTMITRRLLPYVWAASAAAIVIGTSLYW